MVFKSKRDLLTGIIVYGAIGLLAVCSVQIIREGGAEQWLIIILAVIAVMLLWMWFSTYYTIEGHELHYRSGVLHGTIKINTIRSISVNKTMYAGLKPALAKNGCIVSYNKYDEIYMSPKEQELFVKELLKVNPGIEVLV
jgi:hypothetical protein